MKHTLTTRKKGVIREVTPILLARKLFSMGIMPGAHIELIRKGPFGKTFYCIVNFRQRVALRRSEAEGIIID